jgi:hypothetical protein
MMKCYTYLSYLNVIITLELGYTFATTNLILARCCRAVSFNLLILQIILQCQGMLLLNCFENSLDID